MIYLPSWDLTTLAAVAGLLLFIATLKLRNTSRNRIDPQGKCVLITGCDSGLGLESAKMLSRQGFTVFAGCLFPDEAGAQELKSAHSGKVIVLQLDITSDQSVQQGFQNVVEELKTRNAKLWAIVNNAGVCALGFFDWVTWPQIQKMVEVNFFGQIRILKTFLPLITESRGRIVTISSIVRLIPFPGTAVYTATKFGAEGLTEGLKSELAPTGVKLIIIRPGDHSKQTNINKMQETHAKQQWSAMSEEKQGKVETLFRAYHRSVCHRSPGVKSHEEAYQDFLLDMEDSIQSPSPCLYYVSGPRKERIFSRIIEYLPSSWKTALLLKFSAKAWKIKWY